MEMNQILDESHPSFGSQKAVFIFQMDGNNKLIVVEAKNHHAVAALERICIFDQKVSDFCRLIAVIRDYRDLGVRQSDVREIPYVDFFIDVVSRKRLMGDIVAFNALSLSLSRTEIEYMKTKIRLIAEPNTSVSSIPSLPAQSAPMLPSATVDQDDEEEESFVPPNDTVKKALVSLGFNKRTVDSWAGNFNSQGMNNSQMIKSACKSLSRSA